MSERIEVSAADYHKAHTEYNRLCEVAGRKEAVYNVSRKMGLACSSMMYESFMEAVMNAHVQFLYNNQLSIKS